MARKSPPKKPAEVNLGKAKVTPVQIAFLVDRYLAQNNFTTTLSAFRFETSDLFSKAKFREPPKEVLSLAEILDDYVTLKQQRMMMDQEKRRVEMVLKGIQDAGQVYCSTGSAVTTLFPRLHPVAPPPPPVVAPPTVVPIPPANPSIGSPPGSMIHSVPFSRSSPPMLPIHAPQCNNFSTPITDASSMNKRKTSKRVPKLPPAPKKPRGQSTMESSTIGGITLPSQVGSTNTSKVMTPSKCSVVSSKIIVISPSKQTGYYSIEKSCSVSSSPMKSSLNRLGKGDHVKGRLDFDDSDMPVSSNKPAVAETCTSMDENLQDIFGTGLFDLDTDISPLADFYLDCEGLTFSGHPAMNPFADFIPGSEGEFESGFDPCVGCGPRVLSEMDMNIQGNDPVASVKTVTKGVKIISPVKSPRNSSS